LNLADLIEFIPIEIKAGARWSVVGPEAIALQAKIKAQGVEWLNFGEEIVPSLDGLLLAGALSERAEAQTWLEGLIGLMGERALLLVVEWQDDGLLTYGPDLSLRFKKGRLRRFLREHGFGRVETIEQQSLHYVVSAVKGPAPAEPEGWVEVASLEELPKNGMKLVEVFGRKVVVANTGKEIVAFTSTCPHSGGLLHEGRLRGRNIVCPLHAYIWNVCTGEPVEPAQEDTLRRYPVRVDPARGQVWVALAEPSDESGV
jgi:nitrite reductase/ring-hydroxylating ferredoxin subunit